MLAFSVSFLTSHPNLLGGRAMFRTALGLGVAFLVIALIAGLFGFIGVGSLAWEGAKIFFFIFVVLAVLAFVGGFFFRRGSV
jgi:uncharacterized membrane protein YtjA (UPF0391 family)